MKANTSMVSLLSETVSTRSLDPSLREIAENGFLKKDDCYILRGLSGTTNATRANFDDCTGYECFFNSLHIEDYDAESPFAQARLFVVQVFRTWITAYPMTPLRAIVSADEFSVVVKFHVRRLGEQWLSDNIEGYEDPVLSIDSDEDVTPLFKKA